jgi:hypothetical protein
MLPCFGSEPPFGEVEAVSGRPDRASVVGDGEQRCRNVAFPITPDAIRDGGFSVYSGGLTTDVEARHLNIEVPGLHWDAGAEAYLLTGPCARKR